MRFLLAVTLALAPAPLLTAQDVDRALTAYERGDYATALRDWRALAARGDADAQYRLGVMYAYGTGVEKDFKRARQWYEKAAALGDGRAAYELGVFYELGRGVWQDERRAAYWFQQGAAAGYGPSREKARRYQGFLR